MNAIECRDVRKKFRRITLKSNYGTLKGMLVNLLAGKEGNNGSATEKVVIDPVFHALKGIDLDLPKGKTLGIIGRNGSGKSTLLKLIAGIYRPDSGHIKIDGRVSALIELGAGFHPEFSGRENVFINASILGMPKKEIKKQFDEIVAFAELEDFIDNPVRTYSSGMFMRLGFSVAVHVDPDILLVDEVLAVGDEAFGNKCKDRMESFKAQGKSIILVTHELALVEKWCDLALWLDKGEAMMLGTPARVIDAYLETVAIEENRIELAKGHAPEGDGDEEPDETESGKLKRWGTREAEITSVRMYNDNDEEQYVYPSGVPIKVVIDYKAHRIVDEPVIGIGIHKKDGLQCFGSNTDIEELKIDSLEGEGSIELKFDSLPLIHGNYFLSVAIHAEDGYAYDFHDRMYEFSIRSRIKDIGVFRPTHSWKVDGETLLTKRGE